jgi:hypothetical protein
MIKIAAAVILTAALAMPALADDGDEWSEGGRRGPRDGLKAVEGVNGALNGMWNLARSSEIVSGNATMIAANGTKVTYGVKGTISGDNVTAVRTSPTDGIPCTYIGKVGDGGKFTGSALCNGVFSAWSVTPQ